MRSILSRANNNEAGQALPLFGLMIFVLLGFTALSIDVGRYVWARTSMQAGVDAAALAAAQSMPSQTAADAKAAEYWLDNSGFIQSQGTNVSFQVTYPPGNKAIKVAGEADIPTWFAHLFGVDKWHVTAEGQAESQVLDIAVVLDVSGSMCYDPPGILHTESSESVLMSPGHPGTRPKLIDQDTSTPGNQGIPAGGAANSITIRLNSVAIFNSTSASTNNTNFGYNGSETYKDRNISSRNGIIAIWQNAGAGPQGGYELFDITAINAAANTLTVTRAQTNQWTGVATTKISHAYDAEVWANRSGCSVAARNTTAGNYLLYPFDGTVDNAQYFTTLFNPAYDKMGLATYSTTATNNQALTSSLSGVSTTIGNLAAPTGSTNIAHGIATGKKILDGPGKRANAVRVVVVLTDGIPNMYCTNPAAYTGTTACTTGQSATSPTSCSPATEGMNHAWAQATAAKNAGIIVYVIGLGNGVLDCVLQKLADNGGGAYYKAPTTAQLDDAFEAIAESTHIALVK